MGFEFETLSGKRFLLNREFLEDKKKALSLRPSQWPSAYDFLLAI